MGNVSGPLKPKVLDSLAAAKARQENNNTTSHVDPRIITPEGARNRARGQRKRQHSFANEMQDEPAAVARCSVFPQVNALPGTERELTSRDGDCEIDRREGSADVGRHIVLAFSGV